MVVEFWGLPTLASIISGISSSISKIFVLILLQISWIFQSIPNFLHFDDSEGRYGQKSENQEIIKFANLSQPWNLTFFWGWDIYTLFSFLWSKNTEMKFRPPFLVKTSPKHQENPSKYLIYRPLLQIMTNRPPCSGVIFFY